MLSLIAYRTADLIVRMLPARAADGRWWDSNPDSGYSVDDLAPAVPGPLTGEYAAGATTLSWEPNSESDLAGYRAMMSDFLGAIEEQRAPKYHLALARRDLALIESAYKSAGPLSPA